MMGNNLSVSWTVVGTLNVRYSSPSYLPKLSGLHISLSLLKKNLSISLILVKYKKICVYQHIKMWNMSLMDFFLFLKILLAYTILGFIMAF